MSCLISWIISSNDRSKFRFTVSSRYRVSRMARRSPSRLMLAPVVVFMVRMIGLSEALDGRGGVAVYFHELVRAGQGEHRLNPALQRRQLQRGARGRRLAVEIHEAADGGAVEVLDASEVDDDLARPFG